MPPSSQEPEAGDDVTMLDPTPSLQPEGDGGEGMEGDDDMHEEGDYEEEEEEDPQRVKLVCSLWHSKRLYGLPS